MLYEFLFLRYIAQIIIFERRIIRALTQVLVLLQQHVNIIYHMVGSLSFWYTSLILKIKLLQMGNETLSLQLTSILQVTGYVAVLWPELWLQ